MITRLIMLLALFGFNESYGDGLPVNNMVIGTIVEDFKIPPSEYLIFYSNGGNTDVAFMTGPALTNRTCIIKLAESAALQILLPFCKERYYLPEARVTFHASHIMAPHDVLLSREDLKSAIIVLESTDALMIQHMLNFQFPLSQVWLKGAVKGNFTIAGSGLQNLHPWILPISECSHCPIWLKMLR